MLILQNNNNNNKNGNNDDNVQINKWLRKSYLLINSIYSKSIRIFFFNLYLKDTRVTSQLLWKLFDADLVFLRCCSDTCWNRLWSVDGNNPKKVRTINQKKKQRQVIKRFLKVTFGLKNLLKKYAVLFFSRLLNNLWRQEKRKSVFCLPILKRKIFLFHFSFVI